MKNFDLTTLAPLPSRRQRDSMDRERLAQIALRKHCAKHKGRNHWRNWERRLMALAAATSRKVQNAKRDAERSRFHAQVRAYWIGERDGHP